MISNCIMSPVHLKSERITCFRKELALIKHFIITNRRIHNQFRPLVFVFPQFINLSGLNGRLASFIKSNQRRAINKHVNFTVVGPPGHVNVTQSIADDVRPRPVSRGSGQGAPHPPGCWIQRNVRSFLWYCRRSYRRLNIFSQTCRRRTWFPLILEKCCVRNAFFKLLFWPQVNIWTQVWFTLGCTADCLAVFMPAAVVVRKLSCASLSVLLRQATFSHFLKQTVALLSITK